MNAPATAPTATAALTPAPFATRQQPLADGCFRDIGRLHLADDGSYYALEFTPTLNAEELPGDELLQLITGCTLAGGGWRVPTREELFGLTSVARYNPATHEELVKDTRSDWYITADDVAWSSGRVWFVYFSFGFVNLGGPVYLGFARGVRRVAVSPGQ